MGSTSRLYQYADSKLAVDAKKSLLKIVLPKPHEGQKKVLTSTARWRVLMCGRQWGKSTVCAILTIESLLKGHHVCYVTPNFALGRTFFFALLRLIPQKAITDQNIASLSIKLITGGTVTFFSGEANKSIRGRTFNRVIIDEAAHVVDLETTWTEVISPTLAVTNGDGLFVSTPCGRNYFHAWYQRGCDLQQDYESFHYTSYDSPYVSTEFLEKQKTEIPEAIFQQEYLAIPLSSVGNPFGINHILENTIESLSNKQTVIYGVDIARAIDWSVVVGLDETGCMSYFDMWRGEWAFTEKKIKALPPTVLKIVDSTGVGSVVFEKLQSEISNIMGFIFTVKSKPAIMQELIVAVQQK